MSMYFVVHSPSNTVPENNIVYLSGIISVRLFISSLTYWKLSFSLI